jgi:hypothetical protein
MRAVVLPRPGSADVLEFHELAHPPPHVVITMGGRAG